MKRECQKTAGIAVGTTLAASSEIEMNDGQGGFYAGGAFAMPLGAVTTVLTWYGEGDETDGFMPIYYTDPAGIERAVVSAATAGHAQMIPAACFAFGRLKAVADQPTMLTVILKS